MPKKIPRGCAVPGCPNLASNGIYCKEHAAERQAEYDAQRGTAAHRGYGFRWRRLRKMFLQAHPHCADPHGIHEEEGQIVAATEVDHITPKERGGRDAWDNLQSLCKPCHSRKTAIEDGGWG